MVTSSSSVYRPAVLESTGAVGVFAQHHIKLLRAVGLFRRLPHQCKRLGVIALILIDLNQVSVCARMRGGAISLIRDS